MTNSSGKAILFLLLLMVALSPALVLATGISSPTFTSTATSTSTATFTPTQTPVPAPRMIVAPVPVKAGQPVCMYFDITPVTAKWTVYNTVGEVIATLNFSGPAKQCWDTGAAKLAPGLYWIEIKVVDPDTNVFTEWKRIAIQP